MGFFVICEKERDSDNGALKKLSSMHTNAKYRMNSRDNIVRRIEGENEGPEKGQRNQIEQCVPGGNFTRQVSSSAYQWT